MSHYSHPIIITVQVAIDYFFRMLVSCYGDWHMATVVLQIAVCPFVLFAIVLSVILRLTDSDYTFGICKLFFSRWVPLVAIVLYVLLRFTDSDYPFGIFKLFFSRRVPLYAIVLSVVLWFTDSDNLFRLVSSNSS